MVGALLVVLLNCVSYSMRINYTASTNLKMLSQLSQKAFQFKWTSKMIQNAIVEGKMLAVLINHSDKQQDYFGINVPTSSEN